MQRLVAAGRAHEVLEEARSPSEDERLDLAERLLSILPVDGPGKIFVSLNGALVSWQARLRSASLLVLEAEKNTSLPAALTQACHELSPFVPELLAALLGIR